MQVLERLKGDVIAIVRAPADLAGGLEHADRLLALGFHALEVTVETNEGRLLLERLQKRPDRDFLLGAGTITHQDQLEFTDAIGVDFAVSPGFDPDLADAAKRRRLPYIPGVLTPSEILRARQYGWTLLKLFPAGVMGTEYLRAMSGPFPDVRFMVTGGIRPEDAGAFYAAGAHSIGMGGALADEPDSVVRALLASRPETPAWKGHP